MSVSEFSSTKASCTMASITVNLAVSAIDKVEYVVKKVYPRSFFGVAHFNYFFKQLSHSTQNSAVALKLPPTALEGQDEAASLSLQKNTLYERNKPSPFGGKKLQFNASSQMSNSNSNPVSLIESIPVDESSFELPEDFLFGEWLNEDAASMASGSVAFTEYQINLGDESRVDDDRHPMDQRRDAASKNEKKEAKTRLAFKTESPVEILEDGFKWRKYGKKMVKNSPNPRNYYKCSVEGCSVKKRVERDREDPRFVITTYEGVHNHESS